MKREKSTYILGIAEKMLSYAKMLQKVNQRTRLLTFLINDIMSTLYTEGFTYMTNMTYIMKLMLEFRRYDVREISNEASTSAPTHATIK